MVPTSFQPFFTASAGAAAALIGLLFVAVSVRPEAVFGETARSGNTLVASASFTALLNAFFVSLGALIPGVNLGTFVIVVSPIALLNSLVLGIDALRRPRADREPGRVIEVQPVGLVLVALALYGYELINAVALLRTPHDVSWVYNVTGTLLGVYVYGVLRTWQLLGGRRRGVLSLVVPWIQRSPVRGEAVIAPAARAPGDTAPRTGV
ncbi:MAG TPA: hypothetical protein VKQ30_20215 [Ktedonobacterales bacterium]|nr:hypothetical protein [Ktedonobacterales bacterium]